MPEFLKLELDGPVVILRMNQPERRNVLTGNTAAAEFEVTCSRLTADSSVRAVILTGEGSAFSAGGDLRDMQRYLTDDVPVEQIRQEYRDGIQRLSMAVFNLEVPIIAAVNGPAIGVGFDLACFCDMRIASTKAKFAESFLKVGIIPGDGGTWILPRIVGYARAAEMTFTGDTIDADEALRIGIVSKVVPPEELMDSARELASRIVGNSAQTLRMAKRLLRAGQSQELGSVLDLAAGFQAAAHKGAAHADAVSTFLSRSVR